LFFKNNKTVCDDDHDQVVDEHEPMIARFDEKKINNQQKITL